MLDIFIERIRQKHRTVEFPAAAPALPERFRGRPELSDAAFARLTPADQASCLTLCPTNALGMDAAGLFLDMGLCTFCGMCESFCRTCMAVEKKTEGGPTLPITFTRDWRLGSTSREALLLRSGTTSPPPIAPTTLLSGAFSYSLRLRQVTAAGCGACEADLNVLTTVVFDIGRFGIDFVASPRHADAMVLTGPLPPNMQLAVHKCETAMPAPKIIMAVGACAISGGLFRNSAQETAPAGSTPQLAKAISPVKETSKNSRDITGVAPHIIPDLFIPGCPPHPYTTLDAWLRFLGRPTP